MTTPTTLEAFRATGERVSIETACKAINVDPEAFEGAQAVWLYAGLTYIEERSHAAGGAPMPAPFYVQIERDDYSGTKEQIEARLWFEWVCSEGVAPATWTTDDLATLLNDWCAWTGHYSPSEAPSADELLYAMTIKPENERSHEERRRIEFLNWFIELWWKAQGREDRAAQPLPVPSHGGADPEGQNATRAERGHRIAQLHQQMTESTDATETVTDMIADILHYAVQMGVDPHEAIRTAVEHFNAETRA